MSEVTVVKLPTGESLTFPLEMADEEIDRHVQKKLQKHIAKLQEQKQEKEQAGQVQQIKIDALAAIAQLLMQQNKIIAQQTAILAKLVRDHEDSSAKTHESLERVQKAVSARRVPVRDKSGKLIGSEIDV